MGKRLVVCADGYCARWMGIALSIAIGVVAATAGVRPVRSETPAWDAVVAAAKKEGSVVIYSAAPGAPPITEINNLFQQRYGIRVDALEGRASEIRERVRGESCQGFGICLHCDPQSFVVKPRCSRSVWPSYSRRNKLLP